MNWIRINLIIFMVTLSIVIGDPNAQRSQVDTKLRGHSFGLENFLFQTYEEDPVRNVQQKRVRPVNYRTPNDRGQSQILENFQYESSRLRPNPAKAETPYRKPVEPVAQSNKPVEFFAQTPEPQKIPQEPEQSPSEIVTERIRKRIMMRRRRKRPSNTIQTEDNSEVAVNSIPTPVRIPVFPQVSKVVVRKRLPDSDQRIKPVGVKIISTPEPIQQEVNRTVTETASTTEEITTTEKPSTINLKTFLKQQTETLSLSELLQTQNLSLADLLRGNKDASAILRAKQAISSTTVTTKIKPEIKEEVVTEKTSTKIEVLEITTARPNYNRFHPKIPRTKVEQTTAETIRAVEENVNDIPRPIKRLPPPNAGIDPQTRLHDLRLKLRNQIQQTKQRKTTPAETTTAASEQEPIHEYSSSTTEIPAYKKNRVSFKSANNPELSVIIPAKAKPELEKRPERITNWNNRLPSIKRFGEEKINQAHNLPKVPIEETTIANLDEQVTTPKAIILESKKPEAKDELIELLKSGQNADRLQKILNSRNMTLQELLDNREKPPLQMNISELFVKPQQEESLRPTVFESFPDFGGDKSPAKASDMDSYDEPYAEESARVELIATREPKQFDLSVSKSDVNLNLKPDDLKADTSNSENSALWKLSEKSIYYGSSYGYGESFTVQQETEKPKLEVKSTQLTDSDVLLLENFRRHHKNQKFKIDYSDFVKEEEPVAEDIEKSYIPPAVKSAIIASGVVMGIAFFVFIAIFATCGWKQRQIRLKSSSSILSDTLTKATDKTKRTNTLSPVSFNRSYKKTLDFDESSECGTSNSSSYLWSTLKNTFTSRTSTLKSRLEKEEKLKEDKTTLRKNESRRKVESKLDDSRSQEERFTIKKIDRDRNVISTSFNFKRSPSTTSVNHFNDCIHGY